MAQEKHIYKHKGGGVGTGSVSSGSRTQRAKHGKGLPKSTGKVKHGPSGSSPLPRWYGDSAK